MTLSTLTPSNRGTLCTAKISALSLAMLLMQSNIAMAVVAANPNLQIINNTAKASYNVDNKSDVVLSTTSNQVQVKASALPEYGISLTRPPVQTVAPNTIVNWLNVLTNTSYSDETVELTLDVAPSLSNIKVYQDLNNNGIVDGEDKQILFDNLTTQIKLGQAESIQLIVQALSDANGNSGDSADIKIGVVVLEDLSVSKASATDSLIIVKPKIDFTSPNYDAIRESSQVGEEVYIETSFAQCNIQPNAPDQAWVTVTSSKTNDSYSLKAIETGANTGKYQLIAPTQNNANAIVNDKLIQTLDGDTLTATLAACIDPTTGALNPVDQVVNTTIDITDITPSLSITKEGDVKTASLGDYVNYTIQVTNNGKATAYDVELKDALPRGFDYVKASARVTRTTTIDINQAQTTEFKADGKYQVLSLGNLAANETKKITYRVLVGASSLGGDGINRATAVAKNEQGKPVASREAQWQIEVDRGVMNTDGIIVGKVYHDINRDGIQQKEDGELGVAGVRIYMENGNFIVTDPEGKYNFYGVSAKTHVLKVDRTTIPNATELVIQSNRNTGDANSRFIDLKYGELHRADFGIVGGMAIVLSA